ncbi:MAG: CoA transferase [Dehalococcoidia bacterium]|nr:CoA transferase [Dehalococcoidia bacterium]
MAGPLEGIRVVEMGVWVAGPSCGGVLADWGASVIKVEPPDGDPFRGLFAGLLDVPANPPFELDNRGKRSIVLDLETEQGRDLMCQLLDRTDVFVSNMRPRVLEKYGITYDACAVRNPRLIYCQVSGYGPETDDANRAAYDVGAFWSRAGVTASLVPPGVDLPLQRGGMGDHMTGANAAGAISAALYNREKTGKGQRVALSLFRIGAYMMGWDWNTALRFGTLAPPYDRYHAVNPLINLFKDRDGRWFHLLLLQADRHWPDLLRALERPELGTDPRFADIPSRLANSVELVNEMDAIFQKRTLAEWGPIFDRENVWWAPVNTVMEAVADPLAVQSGALVQVESPEGPVTQVATPADFYGTPAGPSGWAPELGQHTEEVLLELGYDWDRIIAFKEAGAIP